LSQGNLTVNYYYGDPASAQTVLQTAEDTFDRIGKLEGATVDFPVNIWVYRTAQEMSSAIATRQGNGSNGSIVTLGEVAASDTALISRDTDFIDIVRHELAHIVTGAATRKDIAPIPVWINEGISIYSQNQMLPDEQQALSIAIQRNRVLPITSLDASARGTGDVVSLFYSESGSIISFMVKQYGDDKFADFIKALGSNTTDGALQSVYGLDQLGLENAWRQSVNLPQVTLSGNSGSNPQDIPTLVPFGSNPNPTAAPTKAASSQPRATATPKAASSNATSDSGSGNSSLVTIAAILIAVVLILLLAAGGLYLQSKRPRA
ncbi:MAG TPA: peptidase MA family metallohydrolase, partial [Dehalococcoidia bacterium]|nr:peptidase MA family metallohydrolase [Dehalococcoidia bacterium]